MGDRMTYRTRPRIDSIWAQGEQDTAANFAAAGYTGPFTRRQMMELWFRAKKIRVQASCDWANSGSGTSGSVSLDQTLVRQYTADPFSPDVDIDDERILLQVWHANVTLSFLYDLFFGISYLSLETPRSDVPVDENGEYWLSNSTASPLFVTDAAGFDVTTNTSPDVSADLTFSDGSVVTFDLAMTVAGTTSTSNHAASIDITEWYPYADKSGDPAWNINTGLEINGGPGG